METVIIQSLKKVGDKGPMKICCILCDQYFTPDKKQVKQIRKHPHRIILCPECHERIADRVRKRKRQQPLNRHPEG
ncbi:uncharacterized protein YlaI [Planifilum fimeticola]|uniref:Uncharacterized protein YlaI n=2 Tax=Planifilum fimeticola TaxID=201975 RepID=A0A2T0LH31_9BACL|nr:uncharacterized protein YlaI [Planifilum fimeticola]